MARKKVMSRKKLPVDVKRLALYHVGRWDITMKEALGYLSKKSKRELRNLDSLRKKQSLRKD